MSAQKPKRWTPTIWLAASLAASGCAPVVSGGGAFCDVVSGAILFPPDVAQVVARDARGEAVKINAQNAYGARNCEGWK